MKKKLFVLILLLTLLLSGCAKNNLYTQVYHLPSENFSKSFEPYYPLALPGDNGVLLRMPDWLDSTDNLYLWREDTVIKFKLDQQLMGLIEIDGAYYGWTVDGVYRYELDSGETEMLFPLEEETLLVRFWGDAGMLYAIERPSYTLCRYDLKTGVLSREDWLSEAEEAVTLYFFGVVGDELLVEKRGAEFAIYWLNLMDGSRREYPIDSPVYGYRDGALALFRQGSENNPGWDFIRLQDVKTGKQTEIPLPDEILSAENRYDYELLAVGEDAVYWREDHTLYRQTDKGLQAVFAYTGREVYSIFQFYQLIDGVYYFAFLGRPAEGYEVVDLAPYDPEQDTGKYMQFAALMPDGTVYILAKEYYDAAWDS